MRGRSCRQNSKRHDASTFELVSEAVKNVLSTVDRCQKANGFLSESISERSASLLGDGAGHGCQPCRAKRAFAICSAATDAGQSDHAGAVRKDFRVNEAARGPSA